MGRIREKGGLRVREPKEPRKIKRIMDKKGRDKEGWKRKG